VRAGGDAGGIFEAAWEERGWIAASGELEAKEREDLTPSSQRGHRGHRERAKRQIKTGSKMPKRREKRGGKWSGLSESNRHLNLGKSAGNGVSTTYEALSGTLSSI
jgi:hypothetical protein